MINGFNLTCEIDLIALKKIHTPWRLYSLYNLLCKGSHFMYMTHA